MFIINTIFKKNRKGGIYLCKVYFVKGNKIEDFTNTLDKSFFYNEKTGNLEIPFGSGTGYNRITQNLNEKLGFGNYLFYNITIHD